jgi:CheY-like chemotaxis protein
VDRKRRHREIQGLLAAYCLGALTIAEAVAVEEHVLDCDACRDDLTGYQSVTSGLDGAIDRTWARVSGTLAGRREDLDCFLAEVVAAGSQREVATAPVQVLVAADTEAARQVLVSRLHGDDRFAVLGQAASPAQLLSEGVAGLPDVVVVKLASTDATWLEAIAELTAWSPRTRLVAVSGLNARHVADLVTSQPVVQSLASGRPPTATVAAVTNRSAARQSPVALPGPAKDEAPRSIIHEVMRQVGIPIRGAT